MLSSILLLFLLAPLIVYGQTFESVCQGISDLGDCTAKVNIPTGEVSVKNCDKDFFNINGCKTKKTVWYNCPTIRKPLRQCHKDVCVPGTEKSTIQVPCGVNVKSKTVDLCQSIRDVVPSVSNLLDKVGGVCTCMPKVLKLAASSASASSGDFTAVEGAVLNLWGEASQCFANNAFDVKDNKNELTQPGHVLEPANNVFIFRAREIDLSAYTQLATIIAACAFGACDEGMIQGFFQQYISDSEHLMADGVKEFLSPFKSALQQTSGEFQGVKDDIASFPQTVEATRAEVKGIVNGLCSDPSACLDAAFKRLAAKVEDSLNLARDLSTLQTAFDKAVQSANDITNSVDVLIEAFNTLGDLGLAGIFKLFTEQKITKVDDIGQLLQLPKKLPSLFSDMRSAIEALKGTAKDLQTRAPQLGDILDSSWQSESAPVKDAITAIQTSVRNNLLEKVNAITGRINQVQDVLNGLVGRGLTPKIDVKVTSYSRWTDVSMDMPYSKWTRGTYSIAGFKTTFDYPEFFSYPYAASVSFPNHHIPYVRIELGDASNRRSFMEPHHPENNSSFLILDTPAIIPVNSLHPSVAVGGNLFAMTCILAGATLVILIFIMFTSARKILRDNRTVRLQPEEMTSDDKVSSLA